MALYEYYCGECGEVFEVKRPMSEWSERANCPTCGNRSEIIPSVFASPDASQLRVPSKEPFRDWERQPAESATGVKAGQASPAGGGETKKRSGRRALVGAGAGRSAPQEGR